MARRKRNLQQFARTSKSKNGSELVRKHQPQEDVDTIRGMINKYGEKVVVNYYHDNCFMFKLIHRKIEEDYHGDMVQSRSL